MATIKIIITDLATYPHRIDRSEEFSITMESNEGDVLDAFNVLSDMAAKFEDNIKERKAQQLREYALQLLKQPYSKYDSDESNWEDRHLQGLCKCSKTNEKCLYQQWKDGGADKMIVNQLTEY